jgi:hypothetical protein
MVQSMLISSSHYKKSFKVEDLRLTLLVTWHTYNFKLETKNNCKMFSIFFKL